MVTFTRLSTTTVLAAAALLLLGVLLPGFDLRGPGSALAAAALVGAVNALVWPIAARLALPFTVATLGFGALALNAAVLLLVDQLLPGMRISGFWAALVVVLGETALVTLAGAALSLDDDERFARHVARRARRVDEDERTDVPGLLLLELDGLGHDVLRRALRDGNAPNLARWVADGTHVLHPWETELSSQTLAMQAGLLHGRNDELPAFRWWDKAQGRTIAASAPRDAAMLERELSDGRGLLHDGGASRANLLSGDAPHALLTLSRVLEVRPGPRLGAGYATYFASPYNAARTLLLALADVVRERRAAGWQRRHDVRPRIARGWRYAALRAWATVVQRDLQVEAVAGDLAAGRPVVYTTFLAYDEVAHHSGVERADTLAVLRRLDQEIGRLAAAAARAARPYRVVVLSDHGQTQGATFRQRYGTTLEELVRGLCGAPRVGGDERSGEDEAAGRLEAALAEASAGDGPSARAVRRGTELRRERDQTAPRGPGDDEPPEVVVHASGCLGLVSFPRVAGRASRAWVERRFPGLLDGLRAHPGVGFVLVDGVCLGAAGEHDLRAGVVRGDDPLAPFGPRAAAHVARTDGFSRCPDLLLNSTWWPQSEEVCAFEELVGSHGGLGGPQSRPFLLAPADLAADGVGELVGAEAVHRLLRRWLADLGHAAFAADRSLPEPARTGR